MRRDFTLVEVLTIPIIMLLVIGGVIFYSLAARARETARRRACEKNCSLVGAAILSYMETNQRAYYPFAWGPEGEPDAEYRVDLSLALLHPQYVESLKTFRCISTENEPHMESSPAGWTLRDISYGYDCRVHPATFGQVAVFGDMDGPYRGDTGSVQNHKGGQNILYADGHVEWRVDDLCSANPNDNCYLEDPWGADTDVYLVSSPAALGTSYDGYPELHQTIETTDKR